MNQFCINGRFCSQRITGVQRYAFEIIRELDKIVPANFLELVVAKDAINIPACKNITVTRLGGDAGVFWEQVVFPHYVKKQKKIPLNFCGVSSLALSGYSFIHDIKYIRHPEFFSWFARYWYRFAFNRVVHRAKHIFTVSEFSKKEIVDYYKIPEQNITVANSSWQHIDRIEEDGKALEKYHLTSGKYYFAMSSLEPNKNFKWIANTAASNTNDVFVIAGAINNKVFSQTNGFIIPNNLQLIGYVSDEEAKTLMHNCKAFIFPSFYEGFGLPPLEALASGCEKIVLSDILVHHEIYSELASYINPNQITTMITKLISQENKDGAQTVLDRYSWQKSAQIVLNVLMRDI